jgi:hypothetical protein
MNFLQKILAILRPEDHGAALGLPGYSPNVGQNDTGFQPSMNYVNIGGAVAAGGSPDFGSHGGMEQAAPTGGGGNAVTPTFAIPSGPFIPPAATNIGGGPSSYEGGKLPSVGLYGQFDTNGDQILGQNQTALPAVGQYGSFQQPYVPTVFMQDPSQVTPSGNPYGTPVVQSASGGGPRRSVLSGLFGQ